MYIVAPESISTAYFINPFFQSVCLYVYPPIVARQRLRKNVTSATNTRNNREIGRGKVDLYIHALIRLHVVVLN
jgi:hypothetical protein